jgi:hypothetical protein
VQKLLKRSRGRAVLSRSRSQPIEVCPLHRNVPTALARGVEHGQLSISGQAAAGAAVHPLAEGWIHFDDDMKPQLQKQKLNRNSAFSLYLTLPSHGRRDRLAFTGYGSHLLDLSSF